MCLQKTVVGTLGVSQTGLIARDKDKVNLAGHVQVGEDDVESVTTTPACDLFKRSYTICCTHNVLHSSPL